MAEISHRNLSPVDIDRIIDNPASIELFEKMGYSTAPDILYLSKRDNPDA